MIFFNVIWLLVVANIAWLPTVEGLKCYYHEHSPVKFNPPTTVRPDSYFGYSTTYDSFHKSLIIGSPKENKIGEIYDCDIDKRTCNHIPLEHKTNQGAYTHDFWHGATLAESFTERSSFIMTCAPLTYGKLPKAKPTDEIKYISTGTCYVRFNGTSFKKLNPIKDEDRLADNSNPDKYELNMDSFGWSLHISTNTVIVGGPAMYKGRVMKYSNIMENAPNTAVYFPRDTTTQNSTIQLPTFNFGYSVVSGKFNDSEQYYAIGSTYGLFGTGSVHFLTLQKDLVPTAELKIPAQYEKAGTMFGAVLCAPKLNSTLYNDLLVGAPTYAKDENTYSTGAVHVYLSTSGEFPQYHRSIIGQKAGSRFGSAVISVGDINGDLRDDIAIAAPFENEGQGAVYLYSGYELAQDKPLTWLQRIQPQGFESFGMSLSPLHNFFNKGCKELAVGAPNDNVVVVFKCFPSIEINLDVTLNKDQIPTQIGNVKSYKLNIKLRLKFPKKFPEGNHPIIRTRVEVKHPDVTLANPNSGADYVFNKIVEYPKKHYLETVYFTLAEDPNYGIKIKYTVISELLNSENCDEDTTDLVLLSPLSNLTASGSVWPATCLNGCTPNTTLTFITRPTSPYQVGTSDTEQLQLGVLNTGDAAFDACVVIRVRGVPVRSTPTGCVPLHTDDAVTLRCTPSHRIKTNHTWISGIIYLSMGDLTNKNDTINITASLFNDCTIKKSVPYDIFIDLMNELHNVTVKRYKSIEELITMSRQKFIKNGKMIEHKYEVKNNAMTNWVEIQCVFVLENKPYITYYDTVINSYKDTVQADCSDITVSEEEIHRTCIISKLNNKYPIHISLPMKILSDTVKANDSLEVTTTLKVKLSDKNIISESIKTIIRLEDAIVERWIIVVSVLVGLVLMFTIGFIIYECGGLTRTKKMELEALQQSIKRQTINRQSMRLSTAQEQSSGQSPDAGQVEQVQAVEDNAVGEAECSDDTSNDDTKDTAKIL